MKLICPPMRPIRAPLAPTDILKADAVKRADHTQPPKPVRIDEKDDTENKVQICDTGSPVDGNNATSSPKALVLVAKAALEEKVESNMEKSSVQKNWGEQTVDLTGLNQLRKIRTINFK